MTDIIRDIDEEMRRDAFLSRVRRYAWVFLLIVVVVLFIVAAGYFWQNRQASMRSAQASELSSALTLAETDAEAARAQLEALVAGSSGGNAIVAGFELAEIEARAGDTEAAAAALEALAEARGGDAYAKTASLFSAYTELDTAEPASLLARLDPLIAEDASFTALAMELKAQVLIRTGDQAGALALLDQLLARDGLTRDVLGRVQALRDSL
ncbi:MAG: tetratricopeptide repeat protein [Pseudomonadota bacterium]|nr:tetratricopeptide repeat protein [Pseudomonadota bacterium]